MDEDFQEGDIIVTAVAQHYAIGRITAGGTQEHITSDNRRATALALACKLAGTTHRVFLYQSGGGSTFAPVDCDKIRG